MHKKNKFFEAVAKMLGWQILVKVNTSRSCDYLTWCDTNDLNIWRKLWKMISPRILRVYYASEQAQALLENCTFYIAEILLRLLSAGVWYVCVHWEPWVKVNKHTSPLLNMWLRVAAKFTPKLADLLAWRQKCAKIYGKNCSQIGELSRAIESTTRPCLVPPREAFALLSPSMLCFSKQLSMLVNRANLYRIALYLISLQLHLISCTFLGGQHFEISTLLTV